MRLTLIRYCDVMKKIGPLTKKYANLPESYIKRASVEIEYRTPNMIQYLPREKKRRIYNFSTNRPWTSEFKNENSGPEAKEIFIEPIKEWNIFRGDRVQVLVGKDKGKIGLVVQIFQERNWVIVSGLNTKLKRVGTEFGHEGVLIRQELPLLVTTEVALIDPSDNKETKIEWRYTEDGEKVRVSLRTGRVIPMPIMAEETIDYKTPKTYLEQPKDTKAAIVEEVTFRPELKTFEMDIMDEHNIKEDRVPKKTYWY